MISQKPIKPQHSTYGLSLNPCCHAYHEANPISWKPQTDSRARLPRESTIGDAGNPDALNSGEVHSRKLESRWIQVAIQGVWNLASNWNRFAEMA